MFLAIFLLLLSLPHTRRQQHDGFIHIDTVIENLFISRPIVLKKIVLTLDEPRIEFILEVIYFIFSRYYLKTHIPAETVWSFHEDPCTTQDLKLLPTTRNGGVDAEKVYKNSRSQEIKKAVFSKSDVTMEKSTTLQKVRQSPVCRTPCSWTPVDTRPTSTEQNICSQ